MQGMGAALATMLLFRVGYRRILSLSLVGMGVCIIVISLGLQNPSIAGLHIPGFVWLILVATGLGLFTGLHMPTLANAALDLAPDRIPQISGIRATFGTVGGAIGVAFASVMASRAASPTAGIEAAFLAVGVLYFVLAFVALRVPDGPPRRTEQQQAASGGRASVRVMLCVCVDREMCRQGKECGDVRHGQQSRSDRHPQRKPRAGLATGARALDGHAQVAALLPAR